MDIKSGFGDKIKDALDTVGITPERVERWLGHTCNGCEARRERLNQLGRWASRVLAGKRERAEQYLDDILDGQN